MKILMVTDSFYPDSVGGSENVIYNVSKQLISSGNTVVVLVGVMDPSLIGWDAMDGIKIFRFLDYHRTFGFLYIPTVLSYIKAFRRVNKEFQFDIIHFHHALSSFAINLTGGAKKIKKVYHFHGPANKEFEVGLTYRKSKFNFIKMAFMPVWSKVKSLILKYMERFSLIKCDKVIVLSDYMKNNLLDIHKCPSDKIEIIAGGVDLNSFYPVENKMGIREEINLQENKNIIITVRRLVARMGVDNLILGFAEAVKKNKDLYLVVVGDGDTRQYLEDLVLKNGLKDSVVFTGTIQNPKLLSYYQASDLFILPSIAMEGFGLVVLEALACGVPVIATKTSGGATEIISKFDEGFIVPDAEPETMGNAITDFFENKRDLINECRRFVENNFSWRVSTQKIINIYKKLLMQ